MIKAIIFDCFGVVLSDTLQSTYERLGGDFHTDFDFIIDVIEQANRGEIPSSFPAIAEKLGVSVDTYAEALASGREINASLMEYILELRKKFKVAMLSNVGKGRIETLFEDGFLDRHFDVVVASGDVGFAKPEARAYEITAERLGARLDECVFTDDREHYIEGAQHVGMKTILFKSTEEFKEDLSRIL